MTDATKQSIAARIRAAANDLNEAMADANLAGLMTTVDVSTLNIVGARFPVTTVSVRVLDEVKP